MLTIGADPEIIMKLNNEPFSIEGLIGASKAQPLKLDSKGCYLQEDNVLAEFNVNPTEEHDYMNIDIQYCMEQLDYLIPDVVEMSQWSWAEFSQDELSTPQAQEFQCEPDLNAYTGDYFPEISTDTNIRTAGGHIHVSYPEVSQANNFIFTKYLDEYLTLPSLILDKNGHKRREMYGQAGAFRNKSYGLELRTLSNFWIFDEELIKWVFDQTNKAYEAFINQEELNSEIQSIINNNEIENAEEICKDKKLTEV